MDLHVSYSKGFAWYTSENHILGGLLMGILVTDAIEALIVKYF